MRQKQRHKALFHAKGAEKHQQPDSGYNLRVENRQIIHLIYQIAQNFFGTGHPDCRQRACNRRNHRCQYRNHDGIDNSFHHIAVREHLFIPTEREPLQMGQRTGAVEGKYNDIQNRQIEKNHGQCQKDFPADACFSVILHPLRPLSVCRRVCIDLARQPHGKHNDHCHNQGNGRAEVPVAAG